MEYPKITDNTFYDDITEIYNDYKIPKKKKSFKTICYPKKFQLQYPQLFLSEFINPDTPYKGLLVYHEIGSGKTGSAISVAEEWKNYKNILVLLPASLKGNFRAELRSPITKDEYIKPDERKKLLSLPLFDKEYQEIIKKSDERIDKYYTMLTTMEIVKIDYNIPNPYENILESDNETNPYEYMIKIDNRYFSNTSDFLNEIRDRIDQRNQFEDIFIDPITTYRILLKRQICIELDSNYAKKQTMYLHNNIINILNRDSKTIHILDAYLDIMRELLGGDRNRPASIGTAKMSGKYFAEFLLRFSDDVQENREYLINFIDEELF